ncbi:receptor-type tyrosine-protein phosphatase kappa [Plakobranchus ocellatus]|uniref:protein-tyrosine-phosphatase n=1 Tax=Plakobranchus ocellatus TaxID=259542 RepID=A0AAV3YUK3_9GAST|nr:receptor-type tyrosine-protein phosphatase kappa [Plakobranchus ocellatus]
MKDKLAPSLSEQSLSTFPPTLLTRMIHQECVETVVMLTNVAEDGVVKCAQYWPPCSPRVRTIGHLLIQTVEETIFADYAIRRIKFRTQQGSSCREITQFQFTSWPRRGVPQSPVPWLELRRKVRIHHAQRKSRILVHCGTGVSRTACFIATDIAIDEYEKEGEVGVFDIVRCMRCERPMMVRCMDQYRFIYESLQEDFEAGDTGIRLDEGLFSIVTSLEEVNPQTGRTWMYDQFDALNYFTIDIFSSDLSVLRELDDRPINPYGRYPLVKN